MLQKIIKIIRCQLRCHHLNLGFWSFSTGFAAAANMFAFSRRNSLEGSNGNGPKMVKKKEIKRIKK